MLGGPWQLVGWVVLGLIIIWTCTALVTMAVMARARGRSLDRIDRIRRDVGRDRWDWRGR